MEEKKKINEQMEALTNAWADAVTDAWGSMFKAWSRMFEADSAVSFDEKTPMGKAQDAYTSALKTWQVFSSTTQQPETVESLFKGIGALPDLLFKMSQTMTNHLIQRQLKWIEKAKTMGKSFETFDFGDIDEKLFQSWKDLYQNNLRQYLHVPQLGLTRFHQERFLQAIDKFNIFHTAYSEFIDLLYRPISRSLSVMEQKIKTLAEENKLPDDSKSYYRMWIKVLEGDYMQLFKSSEYLDVLGRTVDSLTEFSAVKNRLMEDYWSLFQVPKLSDIDDLYHEIYLLKKKIKQLEKKLSNQN